jgi:transposase
MANDRMPTPAVSQDRKPFVKMTDGERQLVIDLHKKGFCYDDIAAQVGRSKTTVHCILKKHVGLPKPKYYSQEFKDKVIALYRSGKNYQRIATMENVSYSLVYRIIKESQ